MDSSFLSFRISHFLLILILASAECSGGISGVDAVGEPEPELTRTPEPDLQPPQLHFHPPPQFTRIPCRSQWIMLLLLSSVHGTVIPGHRSYECGGCLLIPPVLGFDALGYPACFLQVDCVTTSNMTPSWHRIPALLHIHELMPEFFVSLMPLFFESAPSRARCTTHNPS